ncbi:Hypothetical protein UVM_LOCUS284 [uncultured virus]|nr:Hypothetical protein UVM_LOCUS284 [uncultured virus]
MFQATDDESRSSRRKERLFPILNDCRNNSVYAVLYRSLDSDGVEERNGGSWSLFVTWLLDSPTLDEDVNVFITRFYDRLYFVASRKHL